MIIILLPISVVRSRKLYNGIHSKHRRAVADLCMFHKLRNNLANITIPPMLVPSAKHNCLRLSDNFLPEVTLELEYTAISI